jgi:hypothetical protein
MKYLMIGLIFLFSTAQAQDGDIHAAILCIEVGSAAEAVANAAHNGVPKQRMIEILKKNLVHEEELFDVEWALKMVDRAYDLPDSSHARLLFREKIMRECVQEIIDWSGR